MRNKNSSIFMHINKELCICETKNNCMKDDNTSNRDLTTDFNEYQLECLKNKCVKPENAIILAAGFGMRMVPINRDIHKGLLEIKGEPLIERLIKQLHETDVKTIYIVTGFMKDSFEFLRDKYGVELLFNEDYAIKNNLSSLAMVAGKLGNSYIVPCDIWCKENPFNKYESSSWYMVSDLVDDDSDVRINRHLGLRRISKKNGGNAMIGISYINNNDARRIAKKLVLMNSHKKYDSSFWEEALYDNDKMTIRARVVSSTSVAEINTYEQLRDVDSNSDNLKSDVIKTICDVLNCNAEEIINITVLKKGMTNRSFEFDCRKKKYIMRVPGEGTDMLINRKQEAMVYSQIAGKGLSDNIVYIDSQKGYKITEFIESARTCDPNSVSDLKKCMKLLRDFHDMRLNVGHEFDIFGQIDFYEDLWGGKKSMFKDYKKTKNNVFSMKSYIENHIERKTLSHIDAVPDNFLFSECDGKEQLNIIDWEYAGMQDPHVDIAMFCIYAMYDRRQINRLINIYFEGRCPDETRIKIYCYIAACGLLWSNWCEYKRFLGVEFGEYALRQYRYAKEYYALVEKSEVYKCIR